MSFQNRPLFRLLASVLVCLLSFAGTAYATHFRYGHIVWQARPDLGPSVAEISLFASFRRSGYGAPVIGSVITENIGATTFQFGDGGATGVLRFRVLAFDATQDWIYAIALNPVDPNLPITHTYSGPGPWVAAINSCCRISTLRNAPDGSYRVATTINFSTDVSSALATVPPIVNCSLGPTCSFPVPAGDSDEDALTWRFAAPAENGGMTQPAGLSINGANGLISWPTAGRQTGLWGVQIVIESRTAAGAIRSQVAVDFIINLIAAPVGGTTPVFVAPTPPCGTTLDLVVGKAFTFTIRAMDADVGDSVTLNAIGLPIGAGMTPSLPAGGNPIQSVFSWTPGPTQIATTVVVFTATDLAGRQAQCNMVAHVRGDRDGDGLPDIWETNGYTYNGRFVDLPAIGANPDHKDVFVRIDYMGGLAPKAAALAKVVAAFASVPNSQFAVPNPDGQDGIKLRIFIGNELPFQVFLGSTDGGVYDWTEFEAAKNGSFPEELQLAFHYCIFANIGPTESQVPNSGISRGVPSNDFLVTLGSWPNSGTVDEQAGTFMHELGHNLGLGHGGPRNLAVPDGQVNLNRKPNYLSVMNYSFQMSGLRKGTTFGTFDYSRFQAPDLNEANLNENLGLNSAAVNGYGTVWYCGLTRMITGVANGPIDWNCDANLSVSVSTDVNRGAGTTLRAYNDWANVSFTGGTIGAGIVIDQPLTTPVDERTIQDSIDEPPPPAARLTMRTAGSLVRLAWNPMGQAGEFQYRIYRKTGLEPGSFSLVASVATAAYSEPMMSGTYQYYVTGVNGFGSEGSPSVVVTVVIR